MTKAGKLWSWLAAKLKGSGSSKKDGPPYKGLPPTPFPKARNKSGYSLVIISASGSTRQIELTPLKLRVGVCLLGCLVCVLVVAVAWSGGFRFGKSGSGEPSADLTDQVEKLQEQLRQKELALNVYEKRLKEMQEMPTLAATGPRSPADTSLPASKPDSPTDSEGPLMSLQGSTKSEVTTGALGEPGTDEPHKKQVASRSRTSARRTASTEQDESPPSTAVQQNRDAQRSKAINFDAQDVVAVSETPNNGTLRFRLVKDSPDTPFSGYLFVFVEMVDPRGENTIYAYPKETLLGEEDLPADFRKGETLSFRLNQRVELPFADARPGVSLAKVSILLYSQNGKIVFQRGFDRKEVKIVGAKEAGPEGTRTRAGAERRRAL